MSNQPHCSPVTYLRMCCDFLLFILVFGFLFFMCYTGTIYCPIMTYEKNPTTTKFPVLTYLLLLIGLQQAPTNSLISRRLNQLLLQRKSTMEIFCLLLDDLLSPLVDYRYKIVVPSGSTMMAKSTSLEFTNGIL